MRRRNRAGREKAFLRCYSERSSSELPPVSVRQPMLAAMWAFFTWRQPRVRS
jgi:hypothetical protein